MIAEAEGAWVTDVEGVRYLDMLAAYSALNFGHRHPRLTEAAHAQLDRLTLTSRAFHNDTFPVFCRDLAALAGKDMVLTMNTGAEAVETALKTARRWGYDVKGVAPDRAKILVADGNFHGRTVTIVSFSTDPSATQGFGPFTPGFASVPYGDIDALRAEIDEDTVAFLVEPIQGEARVIVPPEATCARRALLCTERNILLMADEIQSGLGRTGATFACEHEGRARCLRAGQGARRRHQCRCRPWSPIATCSAVPSRRARLTFGGNPPPARSASSHRHAARRELPARLGRTGRLAGGALRACALPQIAEVRGRGLWIGIDWCPRRGRRVRPANG